MIRRMKDQNFKFFWSFRSERKFLRLKMFCSSILSGSTIVLPNILCPVSTDDFFDAYGQLTVVLAYIFPRNYFRQMSMIVVQTYIGRDDFFFDFCQEFN